MTRQITRELIIEKLLSLIDLPVIEHLLLIDERNDIEYCQALQKFDCLLSTCSTTNVNSINKISMSKSNSDFSIKSHDNKFENLKSLASSVKLEGNNQLNKLLSKSSLNIIQKSLAILNQKFDTTKCELYVYKNYKIIKVIVILICFLILFIDQMSGEKALLIA
jgi:hypothetical protein